MSKRRGARLSGMSSKCQKVQNKPTASVHAINPANSSTPTFPLTLDSSLLLSSSSTPALMTSLPAQSTPQAFWRNIGSSFTWKRKESVPVAEPEKTSAGDGGKTGGDVKDDMGIDGGKATGGEKGPSQSKKKKRSVVSRHPNIDWKQSYCAHFVNELMRSKGRGDARWQSRCSDCKEEVEEEEGAVDVKMKKKRDRTPAYRCTHCFMGNLVCRFCCVRRHWDNPFHVIEMWDGSSFHKVALRELGLKIQLNHLSGRCPNPSACYRHLLVIDTTGIHRVNLYFCGCAKKTPQWQQLMRHNLYPGNLREGRISTVATFRYPKTLQLLTLTTKGSMYDFYRAIKKLTNNTGLDVPPSRYRQLLHIIHQWRHLKLVIRAEKGIDDWTDLSEVEEGSLTLRCPSCPYPLINLPFDWKERAKGACGYLYQLVLCMDTNFRLKEQLVSSHSRDPALCDGQGYFVRRKGYEAWLKENETQADKEDEVRFMSLACTGKAELEVLEGSSIYWCGSSRLRKIRHDCQDGEFEQGGALLEHGLPVRDRATDKLAKRRTHWPSAIRLATAIRMTPGIGKLHEPGHEQKDHEEFSLNLIKGAGFTDGKSNERIWGPHNFLGNATKTMGPGARQDLLESQFDFWNWLKYHAMGHTLFRHWRAAVEDLRKLLTAHEDLSENIPQPLVVQWEQLLNKWEDLPFPKAQPDRREANPFRIREQSLSQDQALRELAAEDEARERSSKVSYHSMSAAAFVAASFEVIKAQERVKEKIEQQKREPTLKQSNKLTEERRAIKRRFHSMAEVRAIYLPGLPRYLRMHELEDDMEDAAAEDITVWLLSGLEASEVAAVCTPEVIAAECKLQFARANDALDGVRHTLRVKSRMLLFKNSNVCGQRDSGRSQEVINRITRRVKRFAEQYRTARMAYYRVVREGSGLGELPELAQSDIRALTDPARLKRGPGRRGTREDDLEYDVVEDREHEEEELDLVPADTQEWEYRTKHGTGETRKVNSWIWGSSAQGVRKVSLEDGADEDNELVRAEWCRSEARVRRAREEIALLKEEMRRTLEYLTWAGKRWESLMERVDPKDVDVGVKEGCRAYAREQSELQARLQDSFSSMRKTALQGKDDLETTKDDGWDKRKAVKRKRS
ncbi:hypothetical protein V5O48_013884 [Marasmius crinis-equi]|uniref:CxC2-like cysteine cluster KDZ transposase-associated domain-containing protein n=1 Tax=Marasmius crinis-equi TaxID=585013 RepID=A0ABR3EYX3_9AGAR